MKILVGALLLIVSTPLYATEEVKAKIVYDVDNNRLLAIITNTKNQDHKEKCENYVRSEDGLKILKILSKNNKGRVLLLFTCNLEITEKR